MLHCELPTGRPIRRRLPRFCGSLFMVNVDVSLDPLETIGLIIYRAGINYLARLTYCLV
jgi:hypothetical protein